MIKKFSTLIVSVLLLSACQPVTPADAPATDQVDAPKPCTLEYGPVCGKIQIQCITTPCDPITQTFGNKCEAEAAGAIEITPGECL